MKIGFILLGLLTSTGAAAQSLMDISLMDIKPPESFDNIHVKKLASNTHSSDFLIFVKHEVRRHKHEWHSESLYIMEGEAIFQLGDRTIVAKPGVFIKVPAGVVHSVKVLSATPMKVLSVQAPEYFGKDRVFVD